MLRYLTVFLLAAFASVASMPSVQAGSIYRLQHFIDTYNSSTYAPGGNIGPQATPISYNYNFQPISPGSANYGEVRGNVSRGSIGIRSRAYNNGRYAPARAEIYASYTFDVFFASVSNDPISVVMNFDLAGQVLGSRGYGTLDTNVYAGGSRVGSGRYYQNLNPNTGSGISRNGMLSGFSANGTEQTVSTGAFSVAANQNVTITMQLHTIQGYDIGNPTIAFGNTFNLATSGDVFTILGPNAGGVSVNSSDAGIVNNRFAGVTAVPEPSSILLWSLGLVGATFTRRRWS